MAHLSARYAPTFPGSLTSPSPNPTFYLLYLFPEYSPVGPYTAHTQANLLLHE